MIATAKQIAYHTRLSVILAAMLFFCGAAQWAYAKLNGAPLSPSTWGEAALQFPLEVWAVAMMGGSALTFFGLIYPPKERFIQIGCVVQIAHISFLGFSALFTGGDAAIAAFAFIFLVPLHLLWALRAGYEY